MATIRNSYKGPLLSRYKLLQAFQKSFVGHVYRHRKSSQGNLIASYLYEDLFDLRQSHKLSERVELKMVVVNATGSTRGIRVRRGDGTLGAVVPSSTVTPVPGMSVVQGMVALTQIGAEVKILAKSQLKQIDRVITDLISSAQSVKAGNPEAITVGIAGVNYSENYTGFEGKRRFKLERDPAKAHREAEETCRRLVTLAGSRFDEFLLFRFRATNQKPYPFAWLDPSGTDADYGAALVRIADLYQKRT